MQMKYTILCFIVVFFLVIGALPIKVLAAPLKTTYQAKIIKPDGLPLEASNVNFRFSILDPSATCKIYAEDYAAVNMTATGGLIAFALGSGIRNFPVSPTVFADIFDNSTASFPCDTGGPVSYSPTVTDVRKIVMQFNDGTGWQTVPAMSINSVPYAMYSNKAKNTDLFGGKLTTDFVEVSTIPTCSSVQALQFNGISFSCVNVVSGTFSVTAQSPLVMSGTQISIGQTGATSGQALRWNGSAWAAGNINSNDVSTALGYTPISGASFSVLANDVAAVSAAINSLSGSGITSINGSSSATQSFSVGSAGNAPLFSTSNGVHTLNIPLASAASVTAGLLSFNDYTSFANKISSSTAAVTQVLGYLPASSVGLTAVSNAVTIAQTDILAVSAVAASKVTSSAASIAQVLGYVPAASGAATSDATSLKIANNLSDVASATVARTNLGIGSVLADISSVTATVNSKITSSSASIAEVLGYAPANSSTVATAINNKITSSAASIVQVLGYVPAASGSTDVTALRITNNLSDVSSATVARTNLGLGLVLSDILSVSTTATNALTITNTKITSASESIAEVLGYPPVSATTLIGKVTSSAAAIAQVLGYTPAASGAAEASSLKITNNLSDLASATIARNNLGLGLILSDILSVSATANSKITSSSVSISEALGYAPISATTLIGKITSSAASIAQVLGYVPAASGSTDVTALKIANNLSDVASTTVGLGALSTLGFVDLGTAFASGTLASVRLSDTGVIAGTYNKLTVDAKGRVTSSSALNSLDVTTALGYTPASASAVSQWITSGTSINYTLGNVGIGTDSPAAKLAVSGSVHSTSGGFKFPDGTTQTTASPRDRSFVCSNNADKCIAFTGTSFTTVNFDVANLEVAVTNNIVCSNNEGKCVAYDGTSFTVSSAFDIGGQRTVTTANMICSDNENKCIAFDGTNFVIQSGYNIGLTSHFVATQNMVCSNNEGSCIAFNGSTFVVSVGFDIGTTSVAVAGSGKGTCTVAGITPNYNVDNRYDCPGMNSSSRNVVCTPHTVQPNDFSWNAAGVDSNKVKIYVYDFATTSDWTCTWDTNPNLNAY
jgi:trimeric autotransporter adhesin